MRRLCHHILFLIKGTFLCNGLCVCQNQKSAYNHTCHCVGNCGKYTLSKYLVCRLCINKDVKYRSYNYPADHMCDHVGNYEYSNFAFTEFAFLNVQFLGKQADNHTNECGSDYP